MNLNPQVHPTAMVGRALQLLRKHETNSCRSSNSHSLGFNTTVIIPTPDDRTTFPLQFEQVGTVIFFAVL